MRACVKSNSQTEQLRLSLAVALIALLLSLPLHASEFYIDFARTQLVDDVYLLDAKIDYQLSRDAVTALDSGVPLTITVEMVIEQVNDWWFNEDIAELEQRYLLNYHALSNQYLVNNLNSGAHYAYPSLSLALSDLGQLRNLPLLDAKFVEADERYEVAIQARLDIEELPSPLRPLAYLTEAWRLDSDWQRWSLQP